MDPDANEEYRIAHRAGDPMADGTIIIADDISDDSSMDSGSITGSTPSTRKDKETSKPEKNDSHQPSHSPDSRFSAAGSEDDFGSSGGGGVSVSVSQQGGDHGREHSHRVR